MFFDGRKGHREGSENRGIYGGKEREGVISIVEKEEIEKEKDGTEGTPLG